MENCPAEIWTKIFSFACTDDGSTGRALSLVSKYIRNTSKLVKFQSISVVGYDQICAFTTFIKRNREIIPQIRHLFLSSCDYLDQNRRLTLLEWADRGVVMMPPEDGWSPNVDLAMILRDRDAVIQRSHRYRRAKASAMMELLELVAPTILTLSIYSEHGEIRFPLPFAFPQLLELDTHNTPIVWSSNEIPGLLPSLGRLHISGVEYTPDGFTSLISQIAPLLTNLRISISQYHPLMRIHTELETALGKSPSPSAWLPSTIQKVVIEYPSAPLEHWHPLFQYLPTSQGYTELVESLKGLALADARVTLLEPLAIERIDHRRAEKESRRAEGQWLLRNDGRYGCWLV